MIFFLGEVQCHGAVYLKTCCIFLFYHKFYYTRRINITLINSLILLYLLFAAMISGKCQIRHMFVQVLPCCSLPVPFSTWPRYTSYLRYTFFLSRPSLSWILVKKEQVSFLFEWTSCLPSEKTTVSESFTGSLILNKNPWVAKKSSV